MLELTQELQKRGHGITVITSWPGYNLEVGDSSLATGSDLYVNGYSYFAGLTTATNLNISGILTASNANLTDANITADEVIARCKGKMASFKIPRHVYFVKEFPMTASGKIRKVDLREKALRLLGD